MHRLIVYLNPANQSSDYEIERQPALPLGLFLAKVRHKIATDRVIFCQFDRQCDRNRIWKQSDIDYLQQITDQLATVLSAYYYQRHENHHKIDFKKNVAQVASSILKQEKDIVANASKNLEQILQISKTAQRHLFSVAHTANTQIKTALTVSNLKSELNQTSQSIYALSDRTVNSLEKTALTAKDLKNVLDFLKLDRA